MRKGIRKLSLALFLTLVSTMGMAQSVGWRSSVEYLEENVYRIVFEAEIPGEYHMYDMGPYGEGGPMATSIVVTPGPGVELIGRVEMLTTPYYFTNSFGRIGAFEGTPVFHKK